MPSSFVTSIRTFNLAHEPTPPTRRNRNPPVMPVARPAFPPLRGAPTGPPTVHFHEASQVNATIRRHSYGFPTSLILEGLTRQLVLEPVR